MQRNEYDKELIKKTLEALRAARQRMLDSKSNVPRELNRQIRRYAGGQVRNPRDFDSEIKSIIVADMFDGSDYKLDPKTNKFKNDNDEIVSMKEAMEHNEKNDLKRKELGFEIPTQEREKIKAKLKLLHTPIEIPVYAPIPSIENLPQQTIVSFEEILKKRIEDKNNNSGLANEYFLNSRGLFKPKGDF